MLAPDAVAFKITLAMPAGKPLEDEWTWAQVIADDYPKWPFDGPPRWLEEATMKWARPFLPVEFFGNVPDGFETQARELMDGGR